jgi:hypothetical protein
MRAPLVALTDAQAAKLATILDEVDRSHPA